MKLYEIKKIINNFNPNNFIVWIVANISDTIQNEEDYITHADFSEFFSKAEFASISSSIISSFGYVRIFYSETELIEYVIEKRNKLDTNHILIFNFSRDGVCEGKKSLIPAFCDLYNLKYTSSNAFVISLLRNKFIFSKYLSSLQIPTPPSIIYKHGETNNIRDLINKKVIIKNIFESASIGMDESNIIDLVDSNNISLFLDNKCNTLNSHEIMIQEFISGKECEVFVIRIGNKFHAFYPIMLNINGAEIITSKISDTYDYSFELLSTEFSHKICKQIQETSEKAAKYLNIGTYARFDYRINSNGEFYLIDIAGSPYLTRHSSIEYLFCKILNLKYEDIFLLIAALTVYNYSIEVNCKSDNNNPLDV